MSPLSATGISSFRVFELDGASVLNGYCVFCLYIKFDSGWFGLAKLVIVFAYWIGISLFGLAPEVSELGSLVAWFRETSWLA